MKVSLEWLNDFVDLSGISAEQIAHELTMSGLEVEDIEKTGAAHMQHRSDRQQTPDSSWNQGFEQ